MSRVESSKNLTRRPAVAQLLDPEVIAGLLQARLPSEPVSSGTGVAYDARKVSPGDVFFAWQGSKRHGVELADEVLASGAAFLVSDQPHPRAVVVEDTWAAMRRLASGARAAVAGSVIGVTGSAGKTTVKTMLTAALGGRSTPGNLNTVPPLLAAFVAAARRDAGLPYAASALAGSPAPGVPLVIELGVDHPGEMELLTSFTDPDHGVVTTIGESHLSQLGTVESVAREKAGLLTSAQGMRVAGEGAAMRLPVDVLSRTHVTRLLGSSDPARLPGPAAGEVTGRLTGGTLHALGISVGLPWPGRAMAENALLALATAWLLGVQPTEAAARIVAAPLEKGRLRRTELGGIRLIDDSYNSNPLSAALALEVLANEPGPRVAFLGDMRELGEVSTQRHLELGEASKGLDLVIAIGTEAAAIAEANGAAHHVNDWRGALGLLDRIPAGAAVLVKGSRSLELENLVAAIVERFGPAGKGTAGKGTGGGADTPEETS